MSDSHLHLRLQPVAPPYYPDDDVYDDDSSRPRIRRARLSAQQTDVLNKVFEENNAPCMETRTELASTLGMEIKQISSWFQNKRQKLKNSAFIESSRQPSYSPTTTISSSTPPTSDNNMPANAYNNTHHTSTFQIPIGIVPYGAVVHNGYLGHHHSANTKEEPFEPTLRVSPAPSDVSLSSSYGAQRTSPSSMRPARTSTRARSTRLATSPIPTTAPAHRRTHSNTSNASSAARSTSRARMNDDQRRALQKLFAVNPQPSVPVRQAIADEVGLTPVKVTNWFRNLRQSLRKQGMSVDHKGKLDDYDDETDEEDEEYEALTPNQSPYTAVEHSFPSTSPSVKPRSIDVSMEDALLLLHFSANCHIKAKAA